MTNDSWEIFKQKETTSKYMDDWKFEEFYRVEDDFIKGINYGEWQFRDAFDHNENLKYNFRIYRSKKDKNIFMKLRTIKEDFIGREDFGKVEKDSAFIIVTIWIIKKSFDSDGETFYEGKNFFIRNLVYRELLERFKPGEPIRALFKGLEESINKLVKWGWHE